MDNPLFGGLMFLKAQMRSSPMSCKQSSGDIRFIRISVKNITDTEDISKKVSLHCT